MHGHCAQVLVAAGYADMGPRLTRSNLEFVHLQGLSFTVQNGGEYFYAAAAGWASCRGARSAAALCVRRLLHPRYGIIAAPRTQL